MQKTSGAKVTKRKSRVPAVVPRIVFGATFIGVIPACVITACTGGGATTSSSSSSGALTVAQIGFPCDASDPACQPPSSVATIGFTVAAIGFDAGHDANDDASDASDGGSADASDASDDG